MVTPTGCAPLDAALGGGLPVGLTLVLGDPKVGKSMVLSSLAAEAWYWGRSVLFATLEMSTNDQHLRTLANLVGISQVDVAGRQNTEANARRAKLACGGGLLQFKQFPTGAPVRDLLAWLTRETALDGRAASLVLVDALDFLTSGLTGAKTDVAEQVLVAQRLRRHAQQLGCCIVATAPIPSPKLWSARQLLEAADQVIIVQKDLHEPVRASFEVLASRRIATARFVGPVLTDRALGRMWPVAREVPW